MIACRQGAQCLPRAACVRRGACLNCFNDAKQAPCPASDDGEHVSTTPGLDAFFRAVILPGLQALTELED